VPWEGKVYSVVVLDTWSRRVMGWSIDSTQTAALVTSALDMAIRTRGAQPGVVIHSYHGVQHNVSERGAKKAKRHQAVSGYWHSLATLARWCPIASYLDSAATHGTAALDAVRAFIEGKPWLPPLPAIS
jgi:transposase InsO family protein